MSSVSAAEEISPELAELAHAYGIATEYWDQAEQLQKVAAQTVVAVLAAMGVSAGTPTEISAALADRLSERWRRMLPPVFVTRRGQDAVTWVHAPEGEAVRVWIELEDGGLRHDVVEVEGSEQRRQVDGRSVVEVSYRLPSGLPLGWHTLHAASSKATSSCPLAVAPRRLQLPESLESRAGWGFAVQLYALRSSRSWGVGDFEDLAELAAWSGLELGADFVQINPVHAAEPDVPLTPSPYLPTTRRFVNPLYLRIELIDEYAYLSPAALTEVSALGEALHEANTDPGLIDRDASWAAKKVALEMIWEVPRSAGRDAEFRSFVDEQGEGLRDFATWCVLAETYGADFGQWPEPLRESGSPAVAEFRRSHAHRVAFHCWLQWLADQQLALCQQAARDSQMRVGILQDLAVGVHIHGADAWAMGRVLATGVTVGAPPDMFNQQGQDWSQPPWRPDALVESAFMPFRDMLRTNLRHAGALRIDHILGLFRLWWIPAGMGAAAGTYVKYDHEALLSVLMLEAHRAGAVIIGEDLGTVEPWVQRLLADLGILGTTILWFERLGGGIKPAEQWRQAAMASVTVHDLPPTAGYLDGEHVRLRAELGLLTEDEEDVWQGLGEELSDWHRELTARGLLRPDGGTDDVVVALHRLVAQSPSRLISVALPDTVGDRRSQNQPGTDTEYPNWRLPMTDERGEAVTLERLVRSDLLRRIVAAVGG